MALGACIQWVLEAAWAKLREQRLARKPRRPQQAQHGSGSAEEACGAAALLAACCTAGSGGAWGALLRQAAGAVLDVRTGTPIDPWLRGAALVFGLAEAAALAYDWVQPEQPAAAQLLVRAASTSL